MGNFVYKEKGHSYELDGVKMTGVTTVLGVIAKPMLIGWAAKTAVEHIREWLNERDLADSLASLIESGVLESAVKAHTKKKEDAAEKGTDTHAEIEAYIKRLIGHYAGKPQSSAIFDAPCSPALAKFMKWADENNIRFLSSETPTYSKEWFVAGTPDFTFEKDGKKFVGDLKTYKKIWDRVPHFQCAAYAKMLAEHDPLNPFQGTCIVNINKETGELTDSWTYDLAGDTKAFEAALLLYRQLNQF